MIVAGCNKRPPKTKRNVWNCGNKGNPVLEPGYPSFVTCSNGDLFTNTLFLWSKNGAEYQLPDNVGFPVGGDTKYQYLVLQVHYLDVARLRPNDTSGVDISYRVTKPAMSAGMMSVHINTIVPAFSRSYQEGGCTMGEDRVLHPMAYIVHTHRLGEMVTVWIVRRDKNSGQDTWTILARRSPQDPQSFYNINKEMILAKGDR